MPTQKPRLSLTMEPVTAAQLLRLSQLTGNSQSKIVSEILEGSAEAFQRLIRTLEAAQAATVEMKGKVGQDIKAAQVRMEQQLGLMLDDFDGAVAPLLEEQEKVRRRRSRKVALARDAQPSESAVGATVTPLSNRGVRSRRAVDKSAERRVSK